MVCRVGRGSSAGWPAGRVCVITGGAQGIGWELAVLLARGGARVFTNDVDDQALERAATQAAGMGYGQVYLERADVTDFGQVSSWIEGVRRQAGRIDVLVNNAAFVRWQDVEEMAVDDALRTMRTAYDGMVHTLAAVLPVMREAGSGSIANVGSCLSRMHGPGPSAAYVAGKAAVEAFTDMLRLELAGTPLKVTLVRPGLVAGTDFFRRRVPSSRLPRLADFVPALTAEQVARAVLRGLSTGAATVDVPRYLPLVYRAYDFSPRLVQYLSSLGGPARRDFGHQPPGHREETRNGSRTAPGAADVS
ncbi:SDR family oxidoreductase [Streptomyces sp. NPDC020096]